MIIAIIEDSLEYTDIIVKKLNEMNCKEDIYIYHDSLSYENDLIKKHVEFDIVIMDIELENNNSGIELTGTTNSILPYCQVIYLTAYNKYISDVYETDHIYFINKKDLDKYFPMAINKAKTKIIKRKSQVLIVSWNKAKYEIRQDNIIYIERYRKISIIHLVNENDFKCSKSLSDLYNLLNDFDCDYGTDYAGYFREISDFLDDDDVTYWLELACKDGIDRVRCFVNDTYSDGLYKLDFCLSYMSNLASSATTIIPDLPT